MTALAPASRRITSGWPAIAMHARKTAASPTAARAAPYTSAPLALTSIADDGVFEGYASLFHREDLGRDVVLPGAFRDTLGKRGARGVRLLFQHDPATPIGVWETIREDARGLFVRGRLTLGVTRAREVLELMRAGAVDGLSIGFKTAKARRDRVRGLRFIEAVDLWEISIVTFPLLPGARITAVAQQTAPNERPSAAAKFAAPRLATRGHAQQSFRTTGPADSLHDTARRLLLRIEQRNRDLARVGVRSSGSDTVRADLKSHAALRSSIAGDRALLALTRAALLEQHRLAATKANFNPAQLRVPRGNPDGGQWANGDSDGSVGSNPNSDQDLQNLPNETWPNSNDPLVHLAAAKTKPLTPEAIHRLFRDNKGHHLFPLAEAKLRSNVLSPDALDVLSKATIGGNGELKDQNDPRNPHRGRSDPQRFSNQATSELVDRYIRENKITRTNPMTGTQAYEVLGRIRTSNDARIRSYLGGLNAYINESRTGAGRGLRGIRGGHRGRE